MTLGGPTPTQWRVLGYLRQFHADEDRLPTMDEIARQFGWASSTAALDHMRGLERKGWLDKRGCRWRFARPVLSDDLRDDALELDIKAAGLRLQAVQLDLEDADSGYFELMGERDRLVLRQAELIGQRSADQVQRMELEMAA